MRSFFGATAGLMAFAVVICTLVVFGAILSSVHWTLDLIGQFLLPALCVLAICGLGLILLIPVVRNRMSNAFFALVALIFSAIGWYWVWPDTALAMPPTGETVTFYQHNVWARNPNPDAVVDGILTADADIVALAEAEDRTYGPFSTVLSQRWPYQVEREFGDTRGTRLKLLSKYEIVEQSLAPASARAPAILKARIRTPGGMLTVLVVHFTRPWPFDGPSAQLEQLAGLSTAAEKLSGPIVLLGDFNSAPWGRLSARLEQAGFHLANDRRVGTWPARLPHRPDLPAIDWPARAAIPIDLAYCWGSVTCADHTVGSAHGSDHHSVTFSAILSEKSAQAGDGG